MESLKKVYIGIKQFITENYDKMFVVDDMCIPEMYCMKLAYGINDNIEFSWLEDGGIAYFDNNVKSGGLSSNSFTKGIRKIFFKQIENSNNIKIATRYGLLLSIGILIAYLLHFFHILSFIWGMAILVVVILSLFVI